jgi:hypothetical protein
MDLAIHPHTTNPHTPSYHKPNTIPYTYTNLKTDARTYNIKHTHTPLSLCRDCITFSTCAAIAPAHTLSHTPTRTRARSTMLNVRRITLVEAVALLVGLAALVNAISSAPYVVMGTDPSAGSCVRAAALAAATTTYWYLRRRRSQQRAEVGNVGALPQGGRGGCRPGKRRAGRGGRG